MINRDRLKVLEVSQRASLEAAEIISQLRRSNSVVINQKDGARNLVTQADLQAEQRILEVIRESFPEDAVLTEETHPEMSLAAAKAGPLWIIDPVDGTTNYAQGHLHVGISIAYAEFGEVVVAVVEAPFLGESFHAIKGEGSYLNRERISGSQKKKLVEALVGTGFPYEREDISAVIARITRVLKSCRDVRRNGAASLDLCWTACGRLDAFYETLMPWDMAAGGLIAREAGVRVGHIGGTREDLPLPPELWGGDLLLACPGIYEELDLLLRLEK